MLFRSAGGVPAGLNGLLDAKLVNGINYFLDFTKFDDALRRANLVITGEGQIDEQTLHGKGPFGVALRAKGKKLPVAGLAGKILARKDSELWNYFDVLVPISGENMKLETALRQTAKNLQREARRLGDHLQRGCDAQAWNITETLRVWKLLSVK